MRDLSHHEFERGSERRRSPRFTCGGRAQITCLPSDGLVLPGRLRNLGMGGCYIETASSLQLGTRTEVLVQVNTLCFRAMSLVRAVRASSGIGVEFIRLSAGGHHTLAELIVDLERLQALLTPPILTPQELAESSSSLLLSPLLQRPLQISSVGFHRTSIPDQPAKEPSPAMNGCRSILEVHPLANAVDLFG
jgi:PilZ domain